MDFPNLILSLLILPAGLICIFRPVLFLYIFATLPVLRFLIPYTVEETFTAILRIGSVSVTAEDYLILMMIVCLFVNFFTGRQLLINVAKSPVSRVIMVLFTWDILISALSFLKGVEIEHIFRTLSTESLMFIAMIIPVIRDLEIKRDNFFKYVFLICSVFVILSLSRYQFTKEIEISSSGTVMTLEGNDVVFLIFPVCFILFYNTFFRRHMLLTIAAIALFAVGIHFTGHRSGWLVLLFILTMSYFYSDKKLKLAWIPLWGIMLLLLIIFLPPLMHIKPGDSVLGDFIIRFNDTYNLENPSTQWRLDKWKHSISVMKDNPLLGLGTFPVYSEGILNYPVHNLIFRKITFDGLLGLSILLLFFWILFKQCRLITAADQNYGRFLTVYILSFILFCMFNTALFTPLERVYFFMAVGFINAESINISAATNT